MPIKRKTPARIGIYSGTFNPVHAGHIGFALQAMASAKLDRLYFLPERKPRHKVGVEHFGHRVAMLERAVRPHPRFGVLEYVDISFSVQKTLPRLRQQFPGSQLVFLLGSDVVWGMVHWPHIAQLLTVSELVIGLRARDNPLQLRQAIESWPVQPRDAHFLISYAPDVSSAEIREALRRRKPAKGILSSVARYSNRHWLYVSVA